MFETRIPRKSASCHSPKASVRTPKAKRIPLGIFSVLARTMLAYERLERGREIAPRLDAPFGLGLGQTGWWGLGAADALTLPASHARTAAAPATPALF